MAARVLFVTHSSSLVTPSGRAPRHRCLGSMFLFTSGMLLSNPVERQREAALVSQTLANVSF